MDPAKVFSNALNEEGVDASVAHTYDALAGADEFSVTIDVPGSEKYRQRVQIVDQNRGISHHKSIVLHAQKVAQSFKEYKEDKVIWGDNAVILDVVENDNATCLRCNTSVSLDKLRSSRGIGETSIPRQMPASPDSLTRYEKKMTLLALLRDECESMCPNSPGDYRNI